MFRFPVRPRAELSNGQQFVHFTSERNSVGYAFTHAKSSVILGNFFPTQVVTIGPTFAAPFFTEVVEIPIQKPSMTYANIFGD